MDSPRTICHYAAQTSGASRVAFGFACGLAIQGAGSTRRLPGSVGLLVMAVLVALLYAPIRQSIPFQLAEVVLAFPPMIYASAGFEPGPVLGRACKFLGEISYPLYMIHYPVGRVFNEIANHFDPSGRWLWPGLVIQGVACIGLSYIVLKLFDEPVRRWLSRPRRARPPVATRAAE